MDQLVAACLPDRLHPVSEIILDLYLHGRLPTSEFLRLFHLPNSDYLEVAQCVLHVVMAAPLYSG